MGALDTRRAGSRLAIILTTVIVTTVVIAGGVAVATVGFNSVGSPQIKNGSIRSVDIGNGQVKSADIATNAVRASDIAADAVRSGDIKNGTITSADIADNAVRSLDIRDGTITTADIADGTITSADIADGQITSAKITDGTIDSADIADGAVRTQDINDGAVRTQDINDGAVKPVDLAAKAQPAGVAFADGNQVLALGGPAESVRSVVLDGPAPGHVIVTASANAFLGSTGFDSARCSISDGAIAIDFDHQIIVNDNGVNASEQAIPLSGTRTFAVPAGPTTFRLVCNEAFGSVTISDSQITALYVPQLYTP